MNKFSPKSLLVCCLFTLPVVAGAAVVTESTSAPVSAYISQAQFGGPLDGGKDYSDNNGTPGQTFTTLNSAVTVTAITIKGAGSFGGFDVNRYFVLSISSTPSLSQGSTLTRVAQEVTQAFAPVAGDSYLTFTLATPVTLAANSFYEYDIYTTDNPDPSVQSANGGYYGFANSSGNAYAGGDAMQNGFQSQNSRFSANPGNISTVQSVDRTFFIQAVPEPSTVGLLVVGLLTSGLARRRRSSR